MFIVACITVLLTLGTRESARVNAVMVVIKLAILLFFVVVAFTAFNGGNFVPFAPQGVGGVAAAAGVISSPISASTLSRPGRGVQEPGS